MTSTTTEHEPSRDTVVRADGDDVVLTPRHRHGRRAWVLLAIGLFQVWLWATRVVNLVQDPEPRTLGFVVVHAVLYVAAFGAAGVLLAVGWRMRREAGTSSGRGGAP